MTPAPQQRNGTTAFILAAAALLFIIIPPALAFPPIAAEFYGSVRINGHEAAAGTNITVLDSEGTVCGRQLTTRTGQYGLLSCNGNDPGTERDEGAEKEEQVTLLVNGVPAAAAAWQEGQLQELPLNIAPVPPAEPPAAIRLPAAAPPGIFLLPLFPLMLLASLYVYSRRKL